MNAWGCFQLASLIVAIIICIYIIITSPDPSTRQSATIFLGILLLGIVVAIIRAAK